MRDMQRHPQLRVATLTVGSAVVASRGAAYLGAPTTGGLTTFVDSTVPLHVWALVWIAVSVAILCGVWSRPLARVALSCGAALWTVWGISYMWATVVGDSSRGWVTGALMLGVAGFMWILARLIEVLHEPSGEVET